MRPSWPDWLQAALLVVGGLMVAGCILMLSVNDSGVGQYDYWREMLISSPVLGLLGAVILAYRPRHPIGFVLLLSGVANSVAFFAGTFAVAALAHGWPLAAYGAWLENILRGPAFMLGFGLLFHLYPTGALLGRPGRWMVSAMALAMGGWIVALGFAPGPLPDFAAVDNPLGLGALERPAGVLEQAGAVVMITVGLLGGLATIAARLMRSEGDERLQIRVFLYAAIMAVVGLFAVQWVFPGASEGEIGSILWTFLPMTVVAAMATAIVRYRLYDIDRLISRTIGYGLLTTLLVGLYLGLVSVIGTLTPFEQELSVAASTLAVAALFNPLRGRIQSLVDRRFHRVRYDAASTVERFSRQLRADAGLESVADALRSAASATLHPASISVWLRTGDGSGPGL